MDSLCSQLLIYWCWRTLYSVHRLLLLLVRTTALNKLYTSIPTLHFLFVPFGYFILFFYLIGCFLYFRLGIYICIVCYVCVSVCARVGRKVKVVVSDGKWRQESTMLSIARAICLFNSICYLSMAHLLNWFRS